MGVETIYRVPGPNPSFPLLETIDKCLTRINRNPQPLNP
jgi:hypothetical protein